MRTTIIILILFLFSCGQSLPTRHYKSLDNVTGGFNDFSLDLFSDGKLALIIKTSKAVHETDSGTTWEIITKTVNGTWNINNKKINYSLDKPESSVDSVFINTGFNEFMSRPILIFSQKQDTAFIYGLPCILTNK